ncbi:MAG: ferredoxin [Thermoleophilia bacterium]
MSLVHVLVCRGPDCLSRGAQDVYTALAAETHRLGLSDEEVVQSVCGCVGPVCGAGPVVCCYPTGAWYTGVTPDDVPEIVQHDIAGGRVVERLEARRVEGAA